MNPDGGSVYAYYDSPSNISDTNRGLVFMIVQPDGSTQERIWQHDRPFGSSGVDAANPYVKTAIQSVAASNAPTKAFVTDYTYDKDGNIVGTSDYDWTSYTNIIHDGGKRPTSFSVRILN